MRFVLFTLAILGLIRSSSYAQQGPPSEPIKAFARLSDDGEFSVEYTVSVPVLEKRVRNVKQADGTFKEKTYNVVNYVFERRTLLLQRFDITTIDGTKVSTESFTTALKKEKTPVLLLAADGKISEFDRHFYREDLFVVRRATDRKSDE